MEKIRSITRNHYLLINFAEVLYRDLGITDYDMRKIGKLVNDYNQSHKFDEFLDKFSIALLKFAQKPIELNGDLTKPIASTPEELLQEFKDYLSTAPDSEQVDDV